jgi:uncharacterized protein YyaL (SSP411 family)
MDASEPSTNGISACNLYRLSSFFSAPDYETLAAETVASFESEMLQYPWLFASFMPAVVARRLGVRGVVVAGGEEQVEIGKIKEFEKQPRGGLGSFVKFGKGEWLRGRNSLLKDFGGDAKEVRVMVCEGGVCKEEGVNGGAGLGDLKDITNALPGSETEPDSKVQTERSVKPEAKPETVVPHVGKENVKAE